MKGPAMECQIWVATEWIIRCADAIFEDISSGEELKEGTARFLRTGPLYEDFSPLSVERWGFWKERLRPLSRMLRSWDSTGTLLRRLRGLWRG